MRYQTRAGQSRCWWWDTTDRRLSERSWMSRLQLHWLRRRGIRMVLGVSDRRRRESLLVFLTLVVILVESSTLGIGWRARNGGGSVVVLADIVQSVAKWERWWRLIVSTTGRPAPTPHPLPLSVIGVWKALLRRVLMRIWRRDDAAWRRAGVWVPAVEIRRSFHALPRKPRRSWRRCIPGSRAVPDPC